MEGDDLKKSYDITSYQVILSLFQKDNLKSFNIVDVETLMCTLICLFAHVQFKVQNIELTDML